MTQRDLFRTLIIPAAHVEAARAIAAGFGPGGVGMWRTELSPTGKAPATHYISSGQIPAEFAGLSPFKEYARDAKTGKLVEASSYAGDAKTVAAFATKAGLSVTEAQIAAIFAAADVSTQEPFAAMERLGLMLVQPDDPMGVKAEEVVKGK